MKCFPSWLSPATVISLVALFVALGGTSYAALGIPRNSVGSAQVINDSLRTADLSARARAALKGNRGPAGPAGAQGEPGPAGAKGTALAYAHILADGTIDTSRSSANVLAVTKTGLAGWTFTTPHPLYCIDVADTVKNIAVTIEDTVIAGPPPAFGVVVTAMNVNATVDPAVLAKFGCPAGTDAAVLPDAPGAGAPFYVLFN